MTIVKKINGITVVSGTLQNAAADVTYSNATSGLTATNVQTAIDEVNVNAITYAKGYINGGVISNGKDLFSSMTSNTAPSGEECWATSQESSSREPWEAFNKTATSDTDNWSTSDITIDSTDFQMNLRKMTSDSSIGFATIQSRTSGNLYYPEDFEIVYTTNDMSGYSNIDLTIRNVSLTSVKTVSGNTMTAGEVQGYVLDSLIPTTATAWGIKITKRGTNAGTYKGLSLTRLDGYNADPSLKIYISTIEARSSDDTANISVASDSLDITTNADWASGTAPTLTSASIFVYATASGYILDDATGSNISGVKRRIGAFITDSSGDIIPFYAYEKAGGIDYNYTTQITDVNASNSGIALTLTNISVPSGIEFDVDVLVQCVANAAGSYPETSAYSYNSSKQVKAGQPDVGSMNSSGTIRCSSSRQIRVTYGGAGARTNRLYTQGYTDWRDE